MGAAHEWVPRGEEHLRWLSREKLTEAERFEVEGVLDLIIERVRAGTISAHFGQLVINRLAEEKVRDWLARTGRTGVWGK